MYQNSSLLYGNTKIYREKILPALFIHSASIIHFHVTVSIKHNSYTKYLLSCQSPRQLTTNWFYLPGMSYICVHSDNKADNILKSSIGKYNTIMFSNSVRQTCCWCVKKILIKLMENFA